MWFQLLLCMRANSCCIWKYVYCETQKKKAKVEQGRQKQKWWHTGFTGDVLFSEKMYCEKHLEVPGKRMMEQWCLHKMHKRKSITEHTGSSEKWACCVTVSLCHRYGCASRIANAIKIEKMENVISSAAVYLKDGSELEYLICMHTSREQYNPTCQRTGKGQLRISIVSCLFTPL